VSSTRGATSPCRLATEFSVFHSADARSRFVGRRGWPAWDSPWQMPNRDGAGVPSRRERYFGAGRFSLAVKVANVRIGREQ